MSARLEIEPGHAPWEPFRDAKLSHVLHRYDMPLIGIFWSDGHSHLFWCAEGEVTDVSVWGYLDIDDAATRLLEMAGDLDEALDEVRIGRPYQVGIATDRDGLLGVVDAGVYKNPHDPLRVAELAFPKLRGSLKRFHAAPRSA
jgi:hypothetical protein